MKLLFSAFALLVTLTFLSTANAAQPTQTQGLTPVTSVPQSSDQVQKARMAYCTSAANAMLRQHVAQADDGTVTVQCLCTVPNDQSKNFMVWCLNIATDKDLSSLQNSIDQSPCTSPESLQNCVNP